MPLGLSGVIRFVVVIVAVVAIVAAFTAGRPLLALSGLVFLVAAAGLGLRARRDQSPPRSSS